jgi:hypothetical protein
MGIPIKFTATRMDGVFTRLTNLRAGRVSTPLSFSFNGVQIPVNKLASAIRRPVTGGSAGADELAFGDDPLGFFVQGRFNFGSQGNNPWERSFNFESRNVTLGAD